VITSPGIEPYPPSETTTFNHASADELESITSLDQYLDTFPTIPLSSVREHYSPDIGDGHVWVTYKGGVYDVTEFMEHHPGGASRIEMVGGGDLSGYWAIYTLHFREHIQELLQSYRIGNLSAADREQIESESRFDNYYLMDPPRDPSVRHADSVTSEMIVASLHPYNAEPRDLRVLTDSFYTPNELFWVRNHNAVPLIEDEEYALSISVNGAEVELSLNDLLTKFTKYEVPATLQCAGNRQEDYNTEDNPLYVAPHWHNTAIGNAVWGGCRLRDVLAHAGLDVDGLASGSLTSPLRWVSFLGYDEDETGVPYGGMIPIEKAVAFRGDCLLAYEMNGEPLPRDHGYPLRLIAPGHAGCRQVKWLREIEVLERPSELDSGSKLDRHFAPNVCFDRLRVEGDEDEELNDAPVIQTLPVQSLICDWRNVGDERVEVRGVAWAGGGKGIARVDVSCDGGKVFKGAKVRSEVAKEWDRNWAWVHFEGVFELSEEQRRRLSEGESVEMELVSKAVDENFNAQPERMEPYYNVLGVCINHWKRIKVQIAPCAAVGKGDAEE